VLPAHQAKVSVLREPCSRSRSLLRHWQAFFGPRHPVQAVRTLAQFATFLRAHWANITATPWPEHDADRHHYIVGWPQAWYVDACTSVLCFETLDADVRGFCSRDADAAAGRRRWQRPGSVAGSRHGRGHGHSTSSADDERACEEIRALYVQDAALHDRHCR